ncbi:hypothetical protein ACJJI3_22830 [Microbulbifer sp. ZKSA004]|uniref:hypothetical protein n=1 Tax=Microbulbifer sp. ZKSA004 TaxID=3243389 RepID=UPI00403A0130
MSQIHKDQKLSVYLWKFMVCLFASSLIPMAYVLWAVLPGLKGSWFGVAVVSAVCSALLTAALPVNNARYYVPSSVVVGVLFYGIIQGYLLYNGAP